VNAVYETMKQPDAASARQYFAGQNIPGLQQTIAPAAAGELYPEVAFLFVRKKFMIAPKF